jgi:chemotaxis protein methyltransferase CheR
VPISTTDFEFVRQLVQTRAAIVLEPQKTYLAEQRLSTLANTEGFASLEQLLTKVRRGDGASIALQRKVIEAMTTNETYFFRDVHPFDAFRDGVVRELIRKRAETKQLNIWSAAASTGQEAYSIAMILKEHYPELRDWRITIIGTDLAANVLEKAKAGRYTQLEINRGLPARLLAKYFTKEGNDWVISRDIAKMVEFKTLNLIETWPALPTFDVVFIRNVLIYFNNEVKEKILTRIAGRMAKDGYLFLGGSETTVNMTVPLRREEINKSAVYRIV